MSSSRNSVAHGKGNIEFSLFHVDRKTLEISVHPNRSVVVKAPLGSDHEEIRTRVARRAGWIIRQRDFFRQFDPRTPARSYVGRRNAPLPRTALSSQDRRRKSGCR